MRPLTDQTPKPLLAVQGQPLLGWSLAQMAAGGIRRVVINTAWLGEQIEARFGAETPTAHGPLTVRYSHEQPPGAGFSALETAGGISRALPWLDAVFWVAAGDVFVPDFVFDAQALARFADSEHLAHVWLVPNPPHNPRGDFGLTAQGLATSRPAEGETGYTFSTIGLYRRELFDEPWFELAPGNPDGAKAALAPLLRLAMDAGRVSAQLYSGRWTDVGTPERLAELNR